jgi:segregation and condensation protein B
MTSSLKAALEAVLFATNHPLSLEAAAEALEAPVGEIQGALEDLARGYESGGRGVRLAELAGGWQILTRPEFSSAVERMLVGRRRARLSRAGLETLAAVAYHQPMTKGEIDTIRGVDCSGALRTLLDRELVTVKGRSDKVGRPLLYVTTDAFLEYFGLRSLEDLPQLEDFAALVDREALVEEVESSATVDSEQDQESSAKVDSEQDQETGSEEIRPESPQADSRPTDDEAPSGTQPEEVADTTEMELQLIEDEDSKQGWEEQ